MDDLLKRNVKLKEKYVSKFITQLLHCLQYLHNSKLVVHRDLKLGNLFLDNQLNIKIGDFGLSAVIKDGEKRKTVCGTPNYIAPEILFGKAGGHSIEADIWSVGVIIYTLLVETLPFQQKSVEAIYKQIELNKYIFPENCDLSSDVIDLISKISISEPSSRPELEEILKHNMLRPKENLAQRIYNNLKLGKYIVNTVSEDHIIFSFPFNLFKGIGYVLNNGICGVYYQDLNNAYIKNNRLVFIKLKLEDSRKIFVTEEHLINNIPASLKVIYENIQYFIKNYGSYITKNIKINLENQGNSNVFVAKVKKINNGLLFVMTNNLFVFDYTDGTKIVIAKEGRLINAFNDDGIIKPTTKVLNDCLDVLKLYCIN